MSFTLYLQTTVFYLAEVMGLKTSWDLEGFVNELWWYDQNIKRYIWKNLLLKMCLNGSHNFHIRTCCYGFLNTLYNEICLWASIMDLTSNCVLYNKLCILLQIVEFNTNFVLQIVSFNLCILLQIVYFIM